MTQPRAALERCVGDVEAFAATHWGRLPLVKAGADRDGFADLLSFDDVDHLITSTGLRAPTFRLVKDGNPLERSRYLRHARVGSQPISDLADVRKVVAEFESGATLVLQGLHRYWPPLASFCRGLEGALTHPVQANAYLTPPTSAGLRVHADAHDVFALQTHGRKQWVVYWEDEAEPRDLTLEAGDALYLPCGTRHAARTVDEPSLHITIGVRPTTWHDVATRAIAGLASEEAFAAPLPVGFAEQPERFTEQVSFKLRDLARAIEKLDPTDVATPVADAFFSARPPLLDGQLRDLLELDLIDDDTVLVRRPGTVCAVRSRGERVEVLLGDRTLSLPAHAEASLRIVEQARTLRPADLAALLDEPGRIVLARRLVREGLLRIDRAGAAR